MSRMTVRVASQDGSVTINYIGSEGLTVHLGKRALSDHTEESLASEIKSTMLACHKAYSNGLAQSLGMDTGPASDVVLDLDDPVVKLQREYTEAVDNLKVQVASPRQLVGVRIFGRADFDVRIRPGTFGRLDVNEEQLAAEVNSAIVSALEEHGKHVTKIHESVYQSAL